MRTNILNMFVQIDCFRADHRAGGLAAFVSVTNMFVDGINLIYHRQRFNICGSRCRFPLLVCICLRSIDR